MAKNATAGESAVRYIAVAHPGDQPTGHHSADADRDPLAKPDQPESEPDRDSADA